MPCIIHFDSTNFITLHTCAWIFPAMVHLWTNCVTICHYAADSESDSDSDSDCDSVSLCLMYLWAFATYSECEYEWAIQIHFHSLSTHSSLPPLSLSISLSLALAKRSGLLTAQRVLGACNCDCFMTLPSSNWKGVAKGGKGGLAKVLYI